MLERILARRTCAHRRGKQGHASAASCSVALVALLVALAVPASANARDVVTNGTLSYSSEKTVIPADPVFPLGFLEARCPEGSYPISGGFDTDIDPTQDPFFAMILSAGNGPPPLDWQITLGADPVAPRDFTVRAVCAGEQPTAVVKSAAIAPQGHGTASARCPGNLHVYGGGGWGTTFGDFLPLSSSFPIDSADHGKQPDDGWKVSAKNVGGNAPLSVIAYCGEAMPTYHHLTVPVTPGSTHTATKGCGASSAAIGGGHRIGGGGFYPDASPIHSMIANPDDFDQFSATLVNEGSQDLELTVYSICGEPGDFG